MKFNKNILYLDSDIVTKAGIFMRLLLTGEDTFTINDIFAFNKKWAVAITKELNYDSYYTTPKDNLFNTLLRYCDYQNDTKNFKLNPLALRNIISSLDNYKKEQSANKMYISVFENLLESSAREIKEKNANIIYGKLETYIENNFVDHNRDKYATNYSSHEIVGKILLIHAEILYQKKLGYNYEISIPTEENILENYDRLLVQERTFYRMIKDDNLSPNELELIAKVIREKKFSLSRQYFINNKVRQSISIDAAETALAEREVAVHENDASIKELDELNFEELLGDLELQTMDALESLDESMSSTQELINNNLLAEDLAKKQGE